METMCVLRDTVDIFDRHIPKCEYPKTVSWLLLRLSGYESHWIRFWKMDGLLCSIVTRKLNRQANKNKIATRIGYSTCYTLVLFVLTPPHLPASPPPPKKNLELLEYSCMTWNRFLPERFGWSGFRKKPSIAFSLWKCIFHDVPMFH